MTSGVFPPHISTPADALDYLPVWAERFGGVIRDGVRADLRHTDMFDVDDFHVDFPGIGTVLTVAVLFNAGLDAVYYKFDLRHTDGTLLWREDNHGGHEHDHGGPCHLHIGPEENRRVPASPATLASIAEKVVATHIRID